MTSDILTPTPTIIIYAQVPLFASNNDSITDEKRATVNMLISTVTRMNLSGTIIEIIFKNFNLRKVTVRFVYFLTS